MSWTVFASDIYKSLSEYLLGIGQAWKLPLRIPEESILSVGKGIHCRTLNLGGGGANESDYW
jgi:hypothetical protein